MTIFNFMNISLSGLYWRHRGVAGQTRSSSRRPPTLDYLKLEGTHRDHGVQFCLKLKDRSIDNYLDQILTFRTSFQHATNSDLQVVPKIPTR